MTAAKAIEFQIIQRLMRQAPRRDVSTRVDWARRAISALASLAVVFLLGSYLQELLWAMVAAATVVSLGLGGGE